MILDGQETVGLWDCLGPVPAQAMNQHDAWKWLCSLSDKLRPE